MLILLLIIVDLIYKDFPLYFQFQLLSHFSVFGAKKKTIFGIAYIRFKGLKSKEFRNSYSFDFVNRK